MDGDSVVEWFGCRTQDLGAPPSHNTAWLFISETGDCLRQVNCLENRNRHLG